MQARQYTNKVARNYPRKFAKKQYKARKKKTQQRQEGTWLEGIQAKQKKLGKVYTKKVARS